CSSPMLVLLPPSGTVNGGGATLSRAARSRVAIRRSGHRRGDRTRRIAPRQAGRAGLGRIVNCSVQRGGGSHRQARGGPPLAACRYGHTDAPSPGRWSLTAPMSNGYLGALPITLIAYSRERNPATYPSNNRQSSSWW